MKYGEIFIMNLKFIHCCSFIVYGLVQCLKIWFSEKAMKNNFLKAIRVKILIR